MISFAVALLVYSVLATVGFLPLIIVGATTVDAIQPIVSSLPIAAQYVLAVLAPHAALSIVILAGLMRFNSQESLLEKASTVSRKAYILSVILFMIASLSVITLINFKNDDLRTPSIQPESLTGIPIVVFSWLAGLFSGLAVLGSGFIYFTRRAVSLRQAKLPW
jgi:D-alanyl-lipoteichoic acid acyltransferase DltB (MBOAT superfamily)